MFYNSYGFLNQFNPKLCDDLIGHFPVYADNLMNFPSDPHMLHASCFSMCYWLALNTLYPGNASFQINHLLCLILETANAIPEVYIEVINNLLK